MTSCTSLFFYPQKQILQKPDVAGVDYEDVHLSASDGTPLHGWLLKTKGPARGVVYFLHGNAENISTHLASVYWLPERGYDVFMLDYRGYGLSGGEPALPEIFDDIESGFNWLDKRYNNREQIFFLGQSIGAALGVYWMAHSPLAQQRLTAVVLDSPFSSYPGMIEDVMQRSWLTWLFAKPVSWCFSSKYDPDRAATLLPNTKSYLFFASSEDQVVPFEQGKALYEALPANKRRVVTQGPHIATFNTPENRTILVDFFRQ